MLRIKVYLIAVVAFRVGFAAGQTTPARATVDPSDPTKWRPIVSPAERETLGLTDVSGRKPSERIDPAIRAELEAKKSRVAPPGVPFPRWSYVEVQFRHRQAGKPNSEENKKLIRAEQNAILNSLSAAHFALCWRARTLPGFVGYIDQEGLDKLEQRRDVTAVILDPKAIPDAPTIICEHMLNPETAGRFGTEPGVKEGRIDADVYRALAQSENGYVFVIVGLNTKSLPAPADDQRGRAIESATGEADVDAAQTRVLSMLSPADFMVRNRDLGPGLTGFATREGLLNLIDHPNVNGIELERVIRIPNDMRTKP